jgi:hypothetical protein
VLRGHHDRRVGAPSAPSMAPPKPPLCRTFRARAPSAQRFGRHDQLECLLNERTVVGWGLRSGRVLGVDLADRVCEAFAKILDIFWSCSLTLRRAPDDGNAEETLYALLRRHGLRPALSTWSAARTDRRGVKAIGRLKEPRRSADRVVWRSRVLPPLGNAGGSRGSPPETRMRTPEVDTLLPSGQGGTTR